jgi:hypothetical protein
MKRGWAFTVLLAAAIGLFAGTAGAYPGETASFKGTSWGTIPAAVMELVGEDTATLDQIYISPYSVTILGEASLSRVLYLYNYKNQLYSVIATAKGKKNHDAMLRYLTGEHKSFDPASSSTYHLWKGKLTNIELYYDQKKDEASVVYTAVLMTEVNLEELDSAMDFLDKKAGEGTASEGTWDGLFDK